MNENRILPAFITGVTVLFLILFVYLMNRYGGGPPVWPDSESDKQQEENIYTETSYLLTYNKYNQMV